MTYLLSPKVDFVFKRIFGNEKHPNILISFLNAVMKPVDLIKSVQIRNSDKNSLQSCRQRYSFVITSGKSVAQERI